MWHGNAATQLLGIRYPIIQGPFGGGLSTVRLAATVSNGGGLGSFGAHQLSPAEIRALAADLRRATSQPFAINLWVSDSDTGGREMTRAEFADGVERFQPMFEELGLPIPSAPAPRTWGFAEQAQAVLEAAPPAFSFVFGIPPAELLAECRRRKIITIGAATTVDEALALEAAGIDLALATGFEAGGHRPSFLKPAEESLLGTFALIPQVVDAVKIPVIAAGGIADERGVAAAFALGAQAVQLGTAFLACEESGTSPLHREILRSPRARSTTLSRGFTGRLARFIGNRFLARIAAGELSPLPFPHQSWFTTFLKRAAAEQKDSEFMALYAGQSAPLLKHRHALDLLHSLAAEIENAGTATTKARLGGWSNRSTASRHVGW